LNVHFNDFRLSLQTVELFCNLTTLNLNYNLKLDERNVAEVLMFLLTAGFPHNKMFPR